MGKMPHITLTNFSKIHGPLIMLHLGAQKMVVASSPLVAKEILKTHDRILSARYIPKALPSKQEELNDSSIGWTETCNERWRFLRTLCRAELFSVKTLDAQSRLREKKVLEMIEHVKGGENDQVEIGELVFVSVFNMLSNLLLSSDLIIGFDERNGGMKSLIRELFDNASGPNISDLYPILSRFDLQGIRRNFKKMRMRAEAIYEPIIEERRRKSTTCLGVQNDFLDVLLMNKFTNAQIHQLFMELFSAGTDTTTSTVEWAMAELIKNPESAKKLIQELDKEVGTTSQVKESHLVNLSYLQACIKETYRLHPPAPLLLPRRAPETCQVMDYTIPENAQVYINIWAMGRDPSIWDDPLMFKPERFLNPAAVDFIGCDFEFIPFGGGRRICPGLPMAGRLVPLVVASLFSSFDWSIPNGYGGAHDLDMTEKFGMTLHKELPLVLIPKPRK